MFSTIEEAENFGGNLAHAIKEYASDRVVKPLEDRIKQLEIKIAYLEAALESHRSLKYMGVYRDGAEYSEGSLVTRDGSMFHCNRTTKATPGDGSVDWQLAVKRGQDGKSAK